MGVGSFFYFGKLRFLVICLRVEFKYFLIFFSCFVVYVWFLGILWEVWLEKSKVYCLSFYIFNASMFKIFMEKRGILFLGKVV